MLYNTRLVRPNSSLKVYLSGPQQPGEGEFKLFKYLDSISKLEETKFGERCLIVGQDSDIFLYSIHVSKKLKIDFLRNSEVYNIDAVKECLLSDLYNNPNEVNEQSKIDLYNDFTLLCILKGTDYFGGIQRFSVDTAWQSYIQLRNSKYKSSTLWKEVLNDDDEHISYEFNIPFLLDLLSPIDENTEFKEMGVNENDEVQYYAKYTKNIKFTWEDVSNPDGTVTIKYLADGNILYSSTGTDKKKCRKEVICKVCPEVKRLYSEYIKSENLPYISLEQHLKHKASLLVLPENSKEEKEQVESYFQIVVWMMEYFKGNNLDYRILYKFSLAPSIASIRNYLQSKITIKNNINLHKPLHPIETFLMMIPPRLYDELILNNYKGIFPERKDVKEQIHVDQKNIYSILEENKKRLDEFEIKNNLKYQKKPSILFTNRNNVSNEIQDNIKELNIKSSNINKDVISLQSYNSTFSPDTFSTPYIPKNNKKE